jgi:hypothetical protein
MPVARPFYRSILSLFAALFFAACAAAQSPVDPGNLPANTLMYLAWHGYPSADIRKNNSLLALWDDPEFAVARASFLDSVVSDSAKQKGKPAMSREDLEKYITLLDNSFVVGYIRQPPSRATQAATAPKASATTGKTGATAAPATPTWDGGFFIYDRAGKEALLSKAVLQLRGQEADFPKITELTVAGVPSLKIERKSGTTYWAEFGKYAASANELPVFEEILNLCNGKPDSSVLSQSSAYQEAKPLLAGGVAEFFLAVPNADQIAATSPEKATAQIRLLLSTLKLEAVHSVAGRVSFEGARSRFIAAILGDTAPGSLFDIWADGQSKPLSMGYLSADTVYYAETQFNLLGIYKTLKSAFAPAVATQTSATTSPLEKMAETRLGMPVPDALNLVTGELAWFQNSPILDDTQKVYLLALNDDKPNALKLTRTLMGDRISSERNDGDTTYLKVSLSGSQTSAGVAQFNFYYLAMTPRALFGASKSDALHKYVSMTPSSPDPVIFKNLLAARAQFPEKLDGFSYLDFQKVDWPGLRAKWIADAKKSAQTAKSTDAAKQSKKLSDWLDQVNPEVFPRHLHSMTGASWKDAKGVHFEEWLD